MSAALKIDQKLAAIVGEAAVEGLLDRRGIKNELGAVKREDPELWLEIITEVGTLAIRALHKQAGR